MLRTLKAVTHRACRHEAGQALALFAFGLVAFLGLVGMSIDVGNLMAQRARQQNAADAAAMAGAAVLMQGGSHAAAVDAARQYAAQNGYADNVTVNHPPLSGARQGDPNAVEVVIDRDLGKYFIQVLYSGPWQARGRAVGRINQRATGFGVIALDPSACRALLMNSNAQVSVRHGGVFVNSTCATDAMRMDSNSTATADLISITGGFAMGANAHPTPTPLVHQPPVPDPFASIPVPPRATNFVMGSGPGSVCKFDHGTHTFTPGYYDCKVLLDSNTRATFTAGDYVFAGGFEANANVDVVWERGRYVTLGSGFKMDSNATIRDPSGARPRGVLLYNSCASSCGSSGPIILASNSTFAVTPYGDPYQNIVIWQDRNSSTLLDFNSNSHTATGALYAANAHISFNSNADVPLQFVSRTVDIDSNARINVDVSAGSTVLISTLALAE